MGLTGLQGHDGMQGEEGPSGLPGLPGEMVIFLLFACLVVGLCSYKTLVINLLL